MAEPMPVSPRALVLEPPADRSGAQAEIAVDERRLAAVYTEHHAFVWRSLLRLGVDEPKLDDAMHDVFMVVARRLHEFEGRASMKTWLFAIVMRVAQAVRRDAAREHARRERLRPEPDTAALPFDAADASRTLQRLLDGLGDDQRAVLVMAELEGMTAVEIAAVIGAKLPTVYSRLRLAREALERQVARARAREERRR